MKKPASMYGLLGFSCLNLGEFKPRKSISMSWDLEQEKSEITGRRNNKKTINANLNINNGYFRGGWVDGGRGVEPMNG